MSMNEIMGDVIKWRTIPLKKRPNGSYTSPRWAYDKSVSGVPTEMKVKLTQSNSNSWRAVVLLRFGNYVAVAEHTNPFKACDVAVKKLVNGYKNEAEILESYLRLK